MRPGISGIALTHAVLFAEQLEPQQLKETDAPAVLEQILETMAVDAAAVLEQSLETLTDDAADAARYNTEGQTCRFVASKFGGPQ